MQPVAVTGGEADEHARDGAVDLGHQCVLEAGGMTAGTPQLSKSRTGSGLGARNCAVGTRRGVVYQAGGRIVGTCATDDYNRRWKHYILCAVDRRDNTFRRKPA